MVSEETKKRVADYKGRNRRKAVYAMILIALLFVISVYSLSISRVDISFTQAMDIIVNHLTGNTPDRSMDYLAWWIDQVVVNDNAPRTIAGICVGVILAVSGAVMQSVTRNPLTDPYTIGISSAALFGVTIAVVFNFCMIPFLDGESAKMVNAFVFSLIPAAAIVFVSSFKRTSPTMMILIGIALMYVFSAFTTFLKFNADPDQIDEIYQWSLGTLVDVDWGAILILIGTSILLVAVIMLMANRINVLCTGDNASVSLGEKPVRVRVICFVVISMATAVAVCYSGTIGFVGLVAPHIARLFVGSNNKILIPLSAIIGAVMLVGADCIVRMLPNVLPVGVITALIGSPLFLYFLYKQRKNSAW